MKSKTTTSLIFSLGVTLLVLVGRTSAQCPTLIWSDEFDGTSLDLNKWSYDVGDGCDKGEGMCGWGNNELQYYTGPDGRNVKVYDGTLKITAKYDSDTNTYTSARLTSLGKADFDLSKPRRIEAKIKLPKDSYGLWPAFWMLPSLQPLTSWPAGGEIDIMEFIGREPNQTYACAHYGNLWNDKSQKSALLNYKNEHAGQWFHVFAVESTKNKLEWFVDGRKVFTLKKDDIEPKFDSYWPFESVFHVILNLAVGGNWPEYPNDTTEFPNTLEVDYVRVYDLSSTDEPTPTIEGDDVVAQNRENKEYCVDVGNKLEEGDDYAPIDWFVPPGASFVEHPNKSNCIKVNFGTKSGYIEATVYFDCGRVYDLWLPIEVKERYKVDYRFWAGNSQATYLSSSGTYAENRATSVTKAIVDPSPATITYQRDLETVYDHITFASNAISNPQLFVQSARKFFMDVRSPTAAPCTRIYIQLEDSSKATPDNYPVGRHSRYLALLPKDDDGDYQKLEFDFYDRPDTSVTSVDQIVILIDSFVQRSDTYYLRNWVSGSAGCTSSCMAPILKNKCQIPAKSEEGACTDGFNNDGVGWNGDATTDCADSDCYLLDPACMNTNTPPPTNPTPVEICNDGIDNDQNGYTDCEDYACADSPLCGSWWNPSCSEYGACVVEGEVGDCCPDALGVYKDCCGSTAPTPASCSVNPECDAAGLGGDCCPTQDGVYLDCCQPHLCEANARCSGLDGACCPTQDGVFLDCCEDRPQSCRIHPQCDALGLTGECCPTPDGIFLDCCEASECSLQPACDHLAGDCCPTADGIFLDCCNLDMYQFEGFTGEIVALEKAP